MPEYRVVPDSPQDEFSRLRTKIQVFGGGYGNGKTAASVVEKVLVVARDYPGANILVARATYPKLNDTIRKEFLKWCPEKWIKSFPRSKNSDNTCTLKNGTTINFRYIAQQGKAASEGEQTTSNLLSATYDLIVVDQMEDPEITEKDFDDLLGRLRGNARYIGDDPTMPQTGPRWFVITLNPTRNWAYRKIIAPYLKYIKTQFIDDQLLCIRHPRDLPNGELNPDAGKPVLDEDGKPQLLMSLVEGSTYTNKHNLGEDFIVMLESSYQGQMRDRFLYGEWAAYEGLVHPMFAEETHCIPQYEMLQYFTSLLAMGITPRFVEGYDFGIAVPCCYLLAFVDRFKNIMVFDGFYKPESEMNLAQQQAEIWRIRKSLGAEDEVIRADPAVFRRTVISKNQRAKTIAELFKEGHNGVRMRAADNEVLRGITKVNQYLTPVKFHRHPIDGARGAPHLYIAHELVDVISEFNGYYWKMDPSGQRIDTPIDKNDHAMNTLKYMLSKEPAIADRPPRQPSQVHLNGWMESNIETTNQKVHRYG